MMSLSRNVLVMASWFSSNFVKLSQALHVSVTPIFQHYICMFISLKTNYSTKTTGHSTHIF